MTIILSATLGVASRIHAAIFLIVTNHVKQMLSVLVPLLVVVRAIALMMSSVKAIKLMVIPVINMLSVSHATVNRNLIPLVVSVVSSQTLWKPNKAP